MQEAFPLAPAGSLASLCDQIVESVGHIPSFFLRKNFLCLLRKVQILVIILKSVDFAEPSTSAWLCLRELHAVLTKALEIVQICLRSSRIHLLLQLPQISLHFHDIGRDISTVFDVLPPHSLRDHELRDHSRFLQLRSDPPLDRKGDSLRRELIEMIDGLQHEQPPVKEDLGRIFWEIGLQKPSDCDSEMECLREMMTKSEEMEPDSSSLLVDSFCLVRYAKLVLFGIDLSGKPVMTDTGEMDPEKEETAIPEDFRCPISLELMRDPVTVCTGQTYDRWSITHWLESGHVTCPNSGQLLTSTELVPNLALRILISRWCADHRIPFDDASPESSGTSGGGGSDPLTVIESKPAIQATKLTALFLVEHLRSELPEVKTRAACQLRLTARSSSALIRAAIVDAGAVPLLVPLLDCGDPVAEENSVTAILNLSIHDGNKEPIVSVEGCLKGIVRVLRSGSTDAMRENAAAALFSLSSASALKERIATEDGAVEGLVDLVRVGSGRAKRDAVSALFNIAMRKENVPRVVQSGAADSVIDLLREVDGGVAEEAAALVAMLTRHAAGVAAVKNGSHGIIPALAWLLRTGSAKAREHAVAALLEVCKNGGQEAIEMVARAPLITRSLQSLLYSGTHRARRKAASLARICGGCYRFPPSHTMPVSLTVSAVPFR